MKVNGADHAENKEQSAISFSIMCDPPKIRRLSLINLVCIENASVTRPPLVLGGG